MTPHDEEIKQLRERIERLEAQIQELLARPIQVIPYQYWDPYHRPSPLPYWPTVTFGSGTGGLWQT